MSKPTPNAQAAKPNADDLQARFNTPIETDRPVNPDPSSSDAFGDVPEVEASQPSKASESSTKGQKPSP